MPGNYNTTPTSTTTLPANTFPVSAVFVPGTASGNLTALQGGPATTDGNSYTSAPMAIYVADGSDVTLGTTTDASSANTLIGLAKAIKANTASVTIGSGTVTANQGGSWAVTANAGTNLNTSALAMDTSVNGVIVSQGSTTSGQKGPLLQGAVTTAAPSYTTTQTSPVSLTTAGAIRVDASATTQPVSGTFWQATQPISAAALPLPTGASTAAKQPALGTAGSASADVITVQGIASMTALKVDGSGVTQPVSGTVSITANSAVNVAQVNGVATTTGNGISGTGVQRVTIASDSTGQIALAASSAVIGHVIADSGSTTAVTQATASNLNAQVQGAAASGAAQAGNPVKIGGPFNTTQPTVTTGQAVDAQMTARGAQIVATGVDTFNTTINAALPTGANTIGAVTQASGPWTSNVTQWNGTTVDTNSGNKSAGTVRVVLATDQPALTNALKVDGSAITQPVSGTVTANQGGAWTVQPGNTANTTPWLVQTQVGTAGGSTPYHNVVSSGTNGTNVKASAGQVYDGSISNTSASAVYFRFYDTSGTPTVGTTTTKRTMQVPGNGTVIFSWPNGLKFTSGIAWGITTAIADNDTTAIGSSVSIDFGYN